MDPGFEKKVNYAEENIIAIGTVYVFIAFRGTTASRDILYTLFQTECKHLILNTKKNPEKSKHYKNATLYLDDVRRGQTTRDKNGSHSLLIEIPRVSPSDLQSAVSTCIILINARRADVNQRDLRVRGKVTKQKSVFTFACVTSRVEPRHCFSTRGELICFVVVVVVFGDLASPSPCLVQVRIYILPLLNTCYTYTYSFFHYRNFQMFT